MMEVVRTVIKDSQKIWATRKYFFFQNLIQYLFLVTL